MVVDSRCGISRRASSVDRVDDASRGHDEVGAPASAAHHMLAPAQEPQHAAVESGRSRRLDEYITIVRADDAAPA